MTALLVVLGAAVGAPLRHLVNHALDGSPWATFAVNVAGSALLGVLVGAAVPPAAAALVGTGFCGALTTYSTFGAVTLALVEDGRRILAVGYALASAVVCLAVAALGVALGTALISP